MVREVNVNGIRFYKKNRRCALKWCRKKLSHFNPNPLCFSHVHTKHLREIDDEIDKILYGNYAHKYGRCYNVKTYD